MLFRQATTNDIKAMHHVRMAVKENVLNNPLLVTHDDYVRYITRDGIGWVCESNHTIVGFAILSTTHHYIWALFVHPDFEQRGIGKKLHDTMLAHAFETSDETIWLSTSAKTRAEAFYRKAGWQDKGMLKGGEIRFEMSLEDWALRKHK